MQKLHKKIIQVCLENTGYKTVEYALFLDSFRMDHMLTFTLKHHIYSLLVTMKRQHDICLPFTDF